MIDLMTRHVADSLLSRQCERRGAKTQQKPRLLLPDQGHRVPLSDKYINY